MSVLIAILIALAGCGSIAALEELPDFLHICQADDPQLSACIQESVRQLQPYFESGYAPMDLPSLNPFTVDEFLVSPKSSGLLVKIKNGRIYNAHNFTTSKLKIIEHGLHYKFQLNFPYFYTNATYFLGGQLLFLQLKGTGLSVGEYHDITSNTEILLEHKPNANGDLSPHVKKLTILTKIGDGRVRFDNLFNGNKELSDGVQEALNDNFQMFSAELMPMINKKLSEFMTHYVNKLFSHFTTEQLFPKLKL